MSAREQLELEIKQLIISSLALEGVQPGDIVNEAPLFGEGLGLDSIDALELVMALQRRFGFKASETPGFGKQALASVASVADFVESLPTSK